MSLGVSLKKFHFVNVGAFLLDTASKIRVIFVVRF